MREMINKYKSIPLSDSDVLKLVENKANVLTYADLSKYDNIDDILGKYGAAFLLYESRPDYGHWTAILKTVDDNGDELIEFFDPYGIFPDCELEWIPSYFRKISGQMYPLLTYLLYYSDYKLSYNEHKFQKMLKGVNTCGRWSALRIVMKDLPLSMFVALFKGKKSDDIVSIITSYDLTY